MSKKKNNPELEAAIELLRPHTGSTKYLAAFELVSAAARAARPNALAALTGDTSKAKQEILTPGYITDFVRDVFGGQIALDPCMNADLRGTVAPTHGFSGPEYGGKDGLAEPWMDCTFLNPPYRYLKKWLAKTLEEAENEPCKYHQTDPNGCTDCYNTGFLGPRHRIIVLCPKRTRSAWYRAAEAAADEVVNLNRVTFVGYNASFPESCVLLGFNTGDSMRIALARHSNLGEAQ